MAGVSTHFIAECKEELEFKIKEREQLLDQLALYDVRIDRYDAVIENMDRSLLPGINEINAGATAAAAAYEDRVSAGCKSDLVWVQTGESTIGLPFGKYGTPQETQITYEVQKNPATYKQYGKWGIKYYRRPKNQDYGSNIITEFYGAIGAGSSNLAIVQTGVAGTIGIQIGDLITDDLENPSVFGIDNLPNVVGFGQSTLVIETKMFRGQVTIGSTVIAQAGAGDTNQIQVGNRIIGTSVLPFETTVVAISSTPVSIEIWDFDFGGFITTTVSAPSLVIDQPALDTTTIDFAIGITSNYQSILLTNGSNNEVKPSDPTNFTVIRTTQSVLDEFDATNNPIDPVTVGIMNDSSVGYGHSVKRVSSTAPPGPFQWREVLGEYEPEPECGAGFVDWYEGTTQWPTLITNTFSSEGVLLSSTSAHASEGTTVTISVGSTLPQKYAIGYTGTSSNNPSFSGCNGKNNAISNAESTRDASISKSQATVDDTLAASLRLRQLRDTLEGQAFVFLQGRAAADAEIVRLTKSIAELEAVDLSQYEPQTNITKNKFSSSTVGVPTT